MVKVEKPATWFIEIRLYGGANEWTITFPSGMVSESAAVTLKISRVLVHFGSLTRISVEK